MIPLKRIRGYKEGLDRLYDRYNRRAYVHPDPLEFLYHYGSGQDQEVAGLVVSCLAYGRVGQILKSAAGVLDTMGPSPYAYLLDTPDSEIIASCKQFVYRFARGEHLAALFLGIKRILLAHGSIRNCFVEGFSRSDENILPALNRFAGKMVHASGDGAAGHLMPLPERGSACKRLNLFLRWMVRRDRVDPGVWEAFPASKLLVPLDVHMHRISQRLGFTSRKQANLPAVIEVTAGFKALAPEDPVRYDFALTRLSIRRQYGNSGGEGLITDSENLLRIVFN